MPDDKKVFNPDWMARYSRPGPRYTSYPTAPVFSDEFGEAEYRQLLAHPLHPQTPLSLYFHIPFCESVCYFCACNVIYTKRRDKVHPYLELLDQEMDLLLRDLDNRRPVEQFHFGGGTPTFMTPRQIQRLWASINSRFHFSPTAEISIELDPRETSDEHIDVLHACGFNRASLGVQDVNPVVQEAINRIQPIEMTRRNYEKLRAYGFRGINFDLIYGLPYQTMDSFSATLDAVLDMRPDRIALFNFAYLPELKKHQRRIAVDQMPEAATKLQIFATATERFLDAGYRYIGMDHFALPDDELHLAQENGTLHRNFQGYTTKGGCDLIGIGVTSIGELADGYAQNAKEYSDYEAAIKSGHLATVRGLRRSDDDRVRNFVILSLINHFALNMSAVEEQFGLRFNDYFARELRDLAPFAEDGMIVLQKNSIAVTWKGRFVIRNICMTFDAYLLQQQELGQRFSRTV